MFNLNKYKKIISLFLVFTLLVPSLFLMKPEKTEATLPVTDPGNTGVNMIDKVGTWISVGFDGITSASEWITKNKEFILDGLAWSFAKLVVKQMVKATVNWINNGFEGNPLFITNFEGFMTDVVDEVIGDYLNSGALSFLCGPFSLDVKLALVNTFYENNKPPKCTLSEAINNAGGALQSLENDFRWGTWLELTNKPANNPIGAYLIAKENILEKIGLAKEKTKQKLSWGKGFLSWEDCDEVEYCFENDDGGYADDGDDGEECTMKKENCVTKTPGSVISDTLNKQLGSGQDALITADEINEIISALMMQLLKNITSSIGLSGSSNLSSSEGEDSALLENINGEVGKDLTKSLEIETEYKQIKNDSLNLILSAKKLVNSLIDCLNITGETDKLEKAKNIRDNEIIIPQTNIKINLNKTEAELTDDITKTDAIILKINTLIQELNVAKTSEEISNIMKEYSNLYPEIVTIAEIGEATIQRDGYGKIADGLENGLTYDVGLLINNYAVSSDVYPPEDNKGLQQRYDECQICKRNNICTVEGEPVRSNTY